MAMTNQELEDKLAEIKLWLDTNFPTKYTTTKGNTADRPAAPTRPTIFTDLEAKTVSFWAKDEWIDANANDYTLPADVVIDADYVKTDNNFTDELHTKLTEIDLTSTPTEDLEKLEFGPFTSANQSSFNYEVGKQVLLEQRDYSQEADYTWGFSFNSYPSNGGAKDFPLSGDFEIVGTGVKMIELLGYKLDLNWSYLMKQNGGSLISVNGDNGQSNAYTISIRDRINSGYSLNLGAELYNLMVDGLVDIRIKLYQIDGDEIKHSIQINDNDWIHATRIDSNSTEQDFNGAGYLIIADACETLNIYDINGDLIKTTDAIYTSEDVGVVEWDGDKWKQTTPLPYFPTNVYHSLRNIIDGMTYIYTDDFSNIGNTITLLTDGTGVTNFRVKVINNDNGFPIKVQDNTGSVFYEITGENQDISFFRVLNEWVIKDWSYEAYVDSKISEIDITNHDHDGEYAKLNGDTTKTFNVESATANDHAVSRTFGDGRYARLAGSSTTDFTAEDLTVAGNIYHHGDTDTYINFSTNYVGIVTGGTRRAYFNANGLYLDAGSSKTSVNEFSTDATLGGNSDSTVPTEKAIKTYVDSFFNKGKKDVIGVVHSGVTTRNNNVLDEASSYINSNNRIYIGYTTNALYIRCHSSYSMAVYGTFNGSPVGTIFTNSLGTKLGSNFSSIGVYDLCIHYSSRIYKVHITCYDQAAKVIYQITRMS